MSSYWKAAAFPSRVIRSFSITEPIRAFATSISQPHASAILADRQTIGAVFAVSIQSSTMPDAQQLGFPLGRSITKIWKSIYGGRRFRLALISISSTRQSTWPARGLTRSSCWTERQMPFTRDRPYGLRKGDWLKFSKRRLGRRKTFVCFSISI